MFSCKEEQGEISPKLYLGTPFLALQFLGGGGLGGDIILDLSFRHFVVCFVVCCMNVMW